MPSSTLAGAPPPGLHARVFAGLCCELQMLAQQYADDKEKVALLKRFGSTRKRSSETKKPERQTRLFEVYRMIMSSGL